MRDEKKDFLETPASWSEGDLVKLDGAPAWSDKEIKKLDEAVRAIEAWCNGDCHTMSGFGEKLPR